MIQLNPEINLIDTPGVLPARLDNWSAAINLAAINSIKAEIYPAADVASALVSQLYPRYPHHFNRYYHLPPKVFKFKDPYELFKIMALAKKKPIDSDFDWEQQIIRPLMADLANGKLKISFEQPES